VKISWCAPWKFICLNGFWTAGLEVDWAEEGEGKGMEKERDRADGQTCLNSDSWPDAVYAA
jgi:hypothetical protein